MAANAVCFSFVKDDLTGMGPVGKLPPMDESLYDSYVEFKSWGDAPDSSHQDFSNLFYQCGIGGEKLKILELGCGAGRFMDWAREQGHDIQGTEIIPQMIESVTRRGFTVHLAPVNPDTLPAKSFDAVVAIDVLEHLQSPDLKDALLLAKSIMKQDGYLIAHFPNGASPFSLYYQSGDFTHNKPLSPTSMRQIAEPLGLRLIVAFNPRSLPPRVLHRLRRRLVYLCRDLIEIVLGLIYFGRRIPLDPNVVVVLKPK
jgi:SAM-dependent methyltransferase